MMIKLLILIIFIQLIDIKRQDTVEGGISLTYGIDYSI